MPTVLRKDGFAVRIYFNDHLPPHVHVFKGEDKPELAWEVKLKALNWLRLKK